MQTRLGWLLLQGSVEENKRKNKEGHEDAIKHGRKDNKVGV